MTPESPIETVESETGYIASLDPESYEHTVAMYLLGQIVENTGSFDMKTLVRMGLERGGLGLSATKGIVDGLTGEKYIERSAGSDGFTLTEKGEDFVTAPR